MKKRSFLLISLRSLEYYYVMLKVTSYTLIISNLFLPVAHLSARDCQLKIAYAAINESSIELSALKQ